MYLDVLVIDHAIRIVRVLEVGHRGERFSILHGLNDQKLTPADGVHFRMDGLSEIHRSVADNDTLVY